MSVQTGLDSAYPPSPAQIAAAKAAGYTSWSGYFAGPNILNGWGEQNFHDVMNAGMGTSAYCSGWADPVAMKTQQQSWGVPRIILDDESGIRSLVADPVLRVSGQITTTNRVMARRMMHGGEARPVLEKINTRAHGLSPSELWMVSAWVQPWLNASGAGQYGNQPVFAGVGASCYVFAGYPGGDPGLSWPNYYPRPADGHPCAWQFLGTHTFSGVGVDSTHYDVGFWAFGPEPHHEEETVLTAGPFHRLTATLKAYAAGSYWTEPFPSTPPAGGVTAGGTYSLDGYRYTSVPVQSPDLSGAPGNQPGPDSVLWHSVSGGWVPDAILDTTKLAGAPGPNVPGSEPIDLIFVLGSGGFPGFYLTTAAAGSLTMAQVDTEIALKIAGLTAGLTQAQVDAEIAKIIAGLPAGLSKDQVDAEILIALGKLPVAPGLMHHHNVLGIVNTGPVIPD